MSIFKNIEDKLFFRAGVEEVYVPGFRIRDLYNAWPAHPRRLQPDDHVTKHQLWLVQLRSLPRRFGGLHLPEGNVFSFQQKLLRQFEEIHVLDVRRVHRGLYCSDVFADPVGRLCTRAEASEILQETHE